MEFSMRMKERSPDAAYVSNNLWLPRKHVHLASIERALTYWDELGHPFLYMFSYYQDHIIVPRSFIEPKNYPKYAFPFIDVRQTSFEEVDVQFHLPARESHPTDIRGRDALVKTRGGILEYACVAGDTILNVNRGGKGFKVTIKTAYERQEGGRYAWDSTISTRIRSDMGGHIGLNKVLAILYKGKRRTKYLELKNGANLRITEDHEALTERGYVKIKDLIVNEDRVVTDGWLVSRSTHKPKQVYRRSSWYKHHPYVRYQKRKDRTALVYAIETHRAVYEARLNNLPFKEFRERCRSGDISELTFVDPSKFHIHHKDGNIHNNTPDNLESLPAEKHLKIHRPGSKAFGHGELMPSLVVGLSDGGLEEVYDIACADPHHNFVANGIVIANCGKGKTLVSVAAWVMKKVPALVIVDDQGLLSQWKKVLTQEDKHLKGLAVSDSKGNPITVGHVQRDVLDFEGHPITVAMIHTLVKNPKRWDERFRRYFGVVIYDEVHTIGAPTFSRAAPMFNGTRWGLTATYPREDGMESVYSYHIGPVIDSDLTHELVPTAVFLRSGIRVDFDKHEEKTAVTDVRGEVNISKYRTWLGNHEERNNRISLMIQQSLTVGRKILVLTHCKAQAELMHKRFPSSGIITGSVDRDERLTMLLDKPLTFAVVKCGKRGLDDPSIDTIYYLTPFKSKEMLNQSMGRAQRAVEGKREVLLFFIEDEDRMSRGLLGEVKRLLVGAGIKYTNEKL